MAGRLAQCILTMINETKMNANEILKKHEDANEMHFHEVDRKWIIEAMEEYAALRQPLVMESDCDHEWLNHSFDHFGFLQEQICDKCGAKQSVP